MSLMLVGLFEGKIESNAKKEGLSLKRSPRELLTPQCTGGISNIDNIVRPILLQRYHDEFGFQQPEALKDFTCQVLLEPRHKY